MKNERAHRDKLNELIRSAGHCAARLKHHLGQWVMHKHITNLSATSTCITCGQIATCSSTPRKESIIINGDKTEQDTQIFGGVIHSTCTGKQTTKRCEHCGCVLVPVNPSIHRKYYECIRRVNGGRCQGTSLFSL